MSALQTALETPMSERQPVAIDTDVAYREQLELIEFYRNRNLILAQENKELRACLADAAAANSQPPRTKRIRRGAAIKES
ncbi:hypothetical protein [Mycoplana ramosa]|uniref:Uncharacterized protein n=1 Tax=Mycoplana ramosa TaxID=40837 RepID=A0ABW3Z1Z6_MYCRA